MRVGKIDLKCDADHTFAEAHRLIVLAKDEHSVQKTGGKSCGSADTPQRHDYRTLRFANYAAGLAPPPPAFDSKARVYGAFDSTDAAVIFPMDGNNDYGDCTIAGRAHRDTIWAAFDETRHIWTTAQCLNLYFSLTGGVDSGLDVLTVMKNWKNSKLARDNILAYVSIDPQDHVAHAAGDRAVRRQSSSACSVPRTSIPTVRSSISRGYLAR